MNVFKEEPLSMFFLLAVIFIAFGLPVVSGYSLTAHYATPSIFPSGIFQNAVRTVSDSALVVDPIASIQMLPWDKMAGDALRKGNMPLWNPYSLTGMPFLANIQSAVLFPVQALQDIMPSYVWTFIYVLRFFVAGIFTFLFLRRIGLDGFPAAAGGIIFALSGTAVFCFRLEPFFNSYIMLPVVLYSFERLYGHWSGKNLLFGSLCFCFMIVSGQPEVSIINAIFAGFYSILRSWQRFSVERRKWAAFRSFIIYPLGILIAMPLLLPVHEYFSWNNLTHRAEFGEAHLNPKVIILQIVPYLLGHIHHPVTRQMKSSILSWDHSSGYVGLISVYLAVLGLLSGKERTLKTISIFMGMSLAIALLKIYGIPPFQWLGTMPFLKNLLFTRYSGAIVAMSIATLSATGMLAIRDDQNISVKKKAFVLTAVLVFILLVPVAGLLNVKLNAYGNRCVIGSLVVLLVLLALLWILVVRRNTGRGPFFLLLLLAAEMLILTQYGLKPGKELLRIISVIMLLAGFYYFFWGKHFRLRWLFVCLPIVFMILSFSRVLKNS